MSYTSQYPSNTTGANIGNTQTGYKAGNKIPKGYKVGKVQNFTPEMMDLFQNMMGQLGPDSYLSRLAGGDEGIFNQIEAPALKQFSGIQGNIASRFSGMGQGARNSSGFQNTQNQAAQDFAMQLQSQRQNLQQQAIKDMMGLGNQLLGQNPYEQFLYEKEKPWWQKLIGSGLRGGGALAMGMQSGWNPAAMKAGMETGNAFAEPWGI